MKIGKGAYTPSLKKEELRTSEYAENQQSANNAWRYTRSASNNNKNNSNAVLPFYEFPHDCTREHVTIQEVYDAYYDCRKHKRNKKSAIDFEIGFETELIKLHRELNNGTYRKRPCIVFCVTRPKLREVFAADFRDRIVQHLLMLRFETIFEKRMIDTSYSCRKGKGTLYGIKETQRQIEEVSNDYADDAYILTCDIKGFFMSIDRQKVLRMVDEVLKEEAVEDLQYWRWLWSLTILTPCEENCRKVGDLSLFEKLPKEKSILMNKGRGLPIGDVTSHYLSNLYLTSFDKWAKAFLGDNGRYGRYADDWVAVHKDKGRLLSMLSEVRKFLKENLNLTLHPDKIYLQEVKKGVKFCGAVVKQKRLYISNMTMKSVYYAVDRYNSGRQDLQSFCQTMNSLFGLLGHFATYAIRWEIWKSIQDKNGLCSHRMQKILPVRRSSSRTPSYCVKETQTSSQQNL